jgi:hypothetical protein
MQQSPEKSKLSGLFLSPRIMKNMGFWGNSHGLIRGTFQSLKKSHESGFISLFFSIFVVTIFLNTNFRAIRVILYTSASASVKKA